MEKLHVFYRICPNNASKSPIFADDKLKFTEYCLKSFVKAFEDVDTRITFILDSCPESYMKMINREIKGISTIYNCEKIGNRGSLLKQVDLICKLPDNEKVYFAEDDYIYLPGAGKKILEVLNFSPFVTLYDHPDYYQEPHYSNHKYINVLADHHWINRMSTCFTFGTKAGYIKESKEIFEKYAPLDFQAWEEITQKRILVSPIPSLATHMVANLLAPAINWGSEEIK